MILRVKVANRIYQMSAKEADGLLKVASEQVPNGVYAVRKNDYLELRNDIYTSITQLKAARREWKRQGFRVYSNGEGL